MRIKKRNSLKKYNYGDDVNLNIRKNIDKVFGDNSEKDRAIPEAVYCYRTIGKVNCYSEPLPGQEANRLIGYDGKSPRSTAATGPLRP